MLINFNKLILRRVRGYKTEPFINLQQLYEFEFSPITGCEINHRGIYDQETIKTHWSQHGFDIYILYYEKLPIGFTVVNLAGMIDNDPEKKDIAEFFIMPRFRNKGIGEWMACKIFSFYKGKWEIRQLPGLEKARSFWLRVINSYTNGDFKEINMNNGKWKGTMQIFIST